MLIIGIKWSHIWIYCARNIAYFRTSTCPIFIVSVRVMIGLSLYIKRNTHNKNVHAPFFTLHFFLLSFFFFCYAARFCRKIYTIHFQKTHILTFAFPFKLSNAVQDVALLLYKMLGAWRIHTSQQAPNMVTVTKIESILSANQVKEQIFLPCLRVNNNTLLRLCVCVSSSWFKIDFLCQI